MLSLKFQGYKYSTSLQQNVKLWAVDACSGVLLHRAYHRLNEGNFFVS